MKVSFFTFKVAASPSLCITHADFNTVFELLNAGVPMVAIPMGDDQPGIASTSCFNE